MPEVSQTKRKLVELQNLNFTDLQAVSITFEKALSTSKLTDYDEFKIPSEEDFIGTRLQAYMRFPTLNTEPTLILGWQNPPFPERLAIKGQNCTFQLQTRDKSRAHIDNHDGTLLSILPPWGEPMQWTLEAPFKAFSNVVLRATFTLQDSTAAIVGNETIYGIRFDGFYIPKGSFNR